jgi:hypothetical protein
MGWPSLSSMSCPQFLGLYCIFPLLTPLSNVSTGMIWERLSSRKQPPMILAYSRRFPPTNIKTALSVSTQSFGGAGSGQIKALSKAMGKKGFAETLMVQTDFAANTMVPDNYHGSTAIGRPYYQKGPVLNNIPRDLYDCLTHGSVRFDIQSCNAMIVLYTLLGGNTGSQLAAFVSDKAAFSGAIASKIGCSARDVKDVINAMISCPDTRVKDVPMAADIKQELIQLHVELVNAHRTLLSDYGPFCQFIRSIKGGDTTYTAIAMFCQDVETAAIFAACETLPKAMYGLEVKHDQIDVTLPETVNIHEVKHRMETAMMEATGIPFRLKVSVVESPFPMITNSGDKYDMWKVEFEQTNFIVERTATIATITADDPSGIVYRKQTDFLFIHKPVEAFVKRWLEDPTRRTYSRVVFKPPPLDEDVPPTHYNLWTDRGFEAEKLDPIGDAGECERLIKTLLQHFRYVTGGEEVVFRYMMCFMAHLIQKPGEKMPICPIAYGIQGTGKGTWWHDFFIKKVLGKHLACIADNLADLFAKFGTEWESRILIYVQETDRKDFSSNYMNIRSFTGSDSKKMERKGVDRVDTDNLCRILLSANDPNSLKTPPDDRRFTCQGASIMPPNPAEHFDVLHADIKNPRVVRAFYEYLQTYPLDVNLREVLKSTELAKSQHQFNMLSTDRGYISSFLRCYLEYADRFWLKRVNDIIVPSDEISIPIPALNAAWKEFTAKYCPNLKLSMEAELNKINLASAELDDDGNRVNVLLIDAKPNHRWLAGRSASRAIHFSKARLMGALDAVIGEYPIDSMVEECGEMFENEYQAFVNKGK